MCAIKDVQPILPPFGVASGHWREPGILRVSKRIRGEALTIYYQRSRFHIYLTVNDFEAAYAWMATIVNQCDKKCFGPFYFGMKNYHWGNIYCWLALAKMVHQFAMAENSRGSVDRWIKDPFERVHLYARYSIMCAVKDVARMGITAKENGWHDFKLELEFED